MKLVELCDKKRPADIDLSDLLSLDEDTITIFSWVDSQKTSGLMSIDQLRVIGEHAINDLIKDGIIVDRPSYYRIACVLLRDCCEEMLQTTRVSSDTMADFLRFAFNEDCNLDPRDSNRFFECILPDAPEDALIGFFAGLRDEDALEELRLMMEDGTIDYFGNDVLYDILAVCSQEVQHVIKEYM